MAASAASRHYADACSGATRYDGQSNRQDGGRVEECSDVGAFVILAPTSQHIGVVHDEYAVSPDGMKVFGVLDLQTEMEGCRFSIGLRNSHDKSMRLAMTCGYRVFVCSNMAFAGDFTSVLAKHSKSSSLIDCISVGVDLMQRNFEPMRKQVETWQRSELTDVTAKVVIYEAFVEGRLEAPKHLARAVHDLYFQPKYEEFRSRTIWSLSRVARWSQTQQADTRCSCGERIHIELLMNSIRKVCCLAGPRRARHGSPYVGGCYAVQVSNLIHSFAKK